MSKRWPVGSLPAGLWLCMALLHIVCLSLQAQAQPSPPQPPQVSSPQPAAWSPWASGEKLIYNLLWPSGMSLGEATLQAWLQGGEVHLDAHIDVRLPDRSLSYVFSSIATPQLCSIRFEQIVREPRRTRDEVFDYDAQNRQVRVTRGNQTISAPSPDCPRDPLVFLYWTRQELAAGRTPSSGVSMETQLPVQIQRANDPPSSSAPAGDHYLVSYPTRYGTRTADVWIRRDQQRVPVTIRASFPLGSFTAQVQ